MWGYAFTSSANAVDIYSAVVADKTSDNILQLYYDRNLWKKISCLLPLEDSLFLFKLLCGHMKLISGHNSASVVSPPPEELTQRGHQTLFVFSPSLLSQVSSWCCGSTCWPGCGSRPAARLWAAPAPAPPASTCYRPRRRARRAAGAAAPKL